MLICLRKVFCHCQQQIRLLCCCLLISLSAYLPLQTRAAQQVHISEYGDRSDQCVLLLHGLARTSASMRPMAEYLADAGFLVINIDYPSRHFSISELSSMAIPRGLDVCHKYGSSQLYAVTHSLGGILLRHYLFRQTIPALKRIVMLAPPNKGSGVVDNLRDLPGFRWLNGPAGDQLGTDDASVPRSLGPIKKDTAIIAGTTSINLFLSTFLEDPDDGKVSLQSARLDGMCAFLPVPVAHPFIMKDETVLIEVLSYLTTGLFTDLHAEYPDCSHR